MKKIILFCFSVALALSVLSSNYCQAQASINANDIKTQLIADWQRAKLYTSEYLNAMPADKYGFKANDSVRSFAQQMLHLAQANLFFITTATGTSKNFGGNLEQRSSAHSRDSVMYYVNASYDFAIQSVTNLDAGKLGEKVSLRGNEATRLTLLQKGFEHQTHHRGQTTIYIRLAGVRPPAERLF
jgi:uncharacterized damage-inducible protein DinB